MPWLRPLPLLLWFACWARLGATDNVIVPPLQTSIYLASITLVPGVFVREGDTYTATYEVKVWPWIFWGETGRATIRIPAADLARAKRGETVNFRGEGINQKKRLRKLTGRVQPDNAGSGKIKIRITADGYTLVFNGTYRFAH
ncbi:MAG: hypothetical protein ACHQ4G_11585 [Opitutales bacterium]